MFFDAFFIFQILDDEISADFYVAVPDMLPKLALLKNKLRKKFPKSKRGKNARNSQESPKWSLKMLIQRRRFFAAGTLSG